MRGFCKIEWGTLKPSQLLFHIPFPRYSALKPFWLLMCDEALNFWILEIIRMATKHLKSSVQSIQNPKRTLLDFLLSLQLCYLNCFSALIKLILIKKLIHWKLTSGSSGQKHYFFSGLFWNFLKINFRNFHWKGNFDF